MKDFVFITDLHINTHSKVRNGDLVQDLSNKVRFVTEYCNQNNAALLIGGDLFDKPSVPDYVKSEFAPIFMSVNNGVYTTYGNHDRLYDNPEYSFKTSLNVWESHKVLQNLDSVDFLDFGDVIVSSKIPVITRNKPQIVVFHGFLNQEDGRNTFRFTDLNTTDQTFVLLGHDHVEYEPLSITDNVKIFRPGSLLRGIRNDSQLRQPKLIHIKVVNGVLKYKMVEIPCRDSSEIFKTKEVSKSQTGASLDNYDLIIDQIRNANNSNMTFEEALKMVSEPDVFEFAMKLLTTAKNENLNKRQNL